MHEFWTFKNDRAFMKGLSTALDRVDPADRCGEAKRAYRIKEMQLLFRSGGFMSYFDSNASDDVLLVLDDLKEIGALDSYSALKQAIALFPTDIDITSYSDREECITNWMEADEDEEGFVPIDREMDPLSYQWDVANDDLFLKFANYARKHRGQFESLHDQETGEGSADGD